MFDRIKRWAHVISTIPMENQKLRADIERLTGACKRLEHQRNTWQEMHRQAGVGYMASQELFMREIVRLAEKAGEQPDPTLQGLASLYAERHTEPHVAPHDPVASTRPAP